MAPDNTTLKRDPKTSSDPLGLNRMADEFGGSLGDLRRTKRARKLGVALAEKPEESLPKILDCTELEGAYRLLSNKDVAWRELLEPHRVRTVERAVRNDDTEVLVVHDTTDMTVRRYWPETGRQNLVPVTSRSQGMLLHASFAVAASGLPLPLGTLEVQPFVHQIDLDKCGEETRQFWQEQGGVYDNEHQRWFDNVARTDLLLSEAGRRAIHVMDREGDSYGLLSGIELVSRGRARQSCSCWSDRESWSFSSSVIVSMDHEAQHAPRIRARSTTIQHDWRARPRARGCCVALHSADRLLLRLLQSSPPLG